MLLKEGQVRIPAGCAISGIFHKDGKRENGENIIKSITTMHDRSNGLAAVLPPTAFTRSTGISTHSIYSMTTNAPKMNARHS